MEGRPIDGGARSRLARILAEDQPDASGWTRRIAAWGRLEGREPCSSAMHLLFHLRTTETEAAGLLRNILSHREKMTEKLGRDPGIRVAGVDYLTHVEPRLSNPVVVDEEDWERTLRSSRSDPLTGLNNREVFHETLVGEIRRSARFGTDLALLLLDLDGFKEINDRHGHLFGDLVLERVGSLLRRSTRQTDVACRYGGEEFSIVLPQTNRLGAFEVGERIRVLLEARFVAEEIEGIRVALTLSAGIAAYPDDGSSATELVSRADAALYDAKASGRNLVRLRHPERRREIRYPARPERRIRLDVSGTAVRPAYPLDISSHGMLLECDAGAPVGATVEVLIEESDGDGGRRPHVLRGKVVRSDRKEGRERLGLALDSPMADSLRSDLADPRRRGAEGRGAA